MKVSALCGGVGGSKFVEGLAHSLPSEDLTIIGNTGDDFLHLGLRICPDLDTVMYRLAGKVNRELGWGRQDETWQVMNQIRQLSGADWFQLGDADLAVHLLRTGWLQRGDSLTDITARLCSRLGVNNRLLPMSDAFCPTRIETDQGILGFQEWFVQHRWQPPVRRVILPRGRRASPAVIEALETADLIIIVPSNPYISIEPILNVRPIRELIRRKREQTLAISPLVGDDAVKGPLARLMRERGLPVTAQTVLEIYRPLIGGFVQDARDREKAAAAGIEVLVSDTLMGSIKDEVRLAETVLAFARRLLP